MFELCCQYIVIIKLLHFECSGGERRGGGGGNGEGQGEGEEVGSVGLIIHLPRPSARFHILSSSISIF